MLRRSLVIILLCALAPTACGGSSRAPGAARTTPAAPAAADPLELPANVPLRPSRAADPTQVRVVRAWSRALRAGDIEAASALWAIPARAQNGTPVLGLATRRAVRLFNGALPCGSVLRSAGGAGRDFTIATVRLTQRRGADCGSGEGATARTAIRVRGGRITEWYRLPDDPDAPGLLPPPDDAGSTAV
jgi:hypothetical protein